MADFAKRAATILKSNANALLDEMEDPAKMLDQSVREMTEELARVRESAVAAVAAEKGLRARLAEQKRLSDQWAQRAKQALEQGNEELARQALERKREPHDEAARLAPEWQSAVQLADTLKRRFRAIKDKVEQARRKRSVLVARQRAAEAHQRIQSTISGMGDSSAFDTFARMEDKVAEMEYQAAANEELGAADADGLTATETEDGNAAEIDDELALLKAKAAAARETPPAAEAAATAASQSPPEPPQPDEPQPEVAEASQTEPSPVTAAGTLPVVPECADVLEPTRNEPDAVEETESTGEQQADAELQQEMSEDGNAEHATCGTPIEPEPAEQGEAPDEQQAEQETRDAATSAGEPSPDAETPTEDEQEVAPRSNVLRKLCLAVGVVVLILAIAATCVGMRLGFDELKSMAANPQEIPSKLSDLWGK